MTNLYAIVPSWAPGNEVELLLAEDDAAAMDHGIYVAAQDIADGNYHSPHAQVFLVAANVRHVGDAHATDAPAEWEWAHPAVELHALERACWEIEADFEQGGGPL